MFNIVVITPTNILIGLGISFGLAMTLTFLTYRDIETFFCFLTIFVGFSVWSALLPLWCLILCLIVLVFIIGNNVSKKENG